MTRVYLAVGHGTKPDGTTHDPGAVNAGADLTEQTAGDIVVEQAAAVLADAGLTLRHEARDPDDPNWVGTVRNANAWDADLTVSVHHDWSGSRLGAHGFHHSTSATGERLGKAILTAVENAGFDVSWDWFKARDELGLLRGTDHPTFLLECGPIGSKALDTPEELRAMGTALAAGILAHLGVEAPPGTSGGADDDEVVPTDHDPIRRRAHQLQAVSSWAAASWEQYVAVGGTTVPSSGVWPAFREDLAWYSFAGPLAARVDALEEELQAATARIAELEERLAQQ